MNHTTSLLDNPSRCLIDTRMIQRGLDYLMTCYNPILILWYAHDGYLMEN